jgi:hypothetical protein
MRYFVLVGVISTAVVAWTGFWFYTAGLVEADLLRRAEQNSETNSTGAHLSYGSYDIGGFPYRIQVTLNKPTIILRNQAQPMRWRTDQIKAVGHPWQPRHVLFDLTGTHHFEVEVDGQWRCFELSSETAMASVETDAQGALQRLSLDLKNILAKHLGADALRGQRLQVHSRPTPGGTNSLDIALRGDALELIREGLPELSIKRLPKTITLLDLQSTVTEMAAAGTELAGGVPQWREQGGTVEVDKLRLQWRDVDITATGSLALDDQMRPIGALTAKIKGHEELLQMAVANGGMDEEKAAIARAVLGLLAVAGGGVLSVPVRLQDGLLYLGPAAIARLAPIMVPGRIN